MPCYFPLRGYRDPFPNPRTGKFRISGIKRRIDNDPCPVGVVAVDIPCGQCVGCRLERSRKWAVRCMNEASLHSDNCFITLTYNDVHLPEWHTLQVPAFQKFMKRFRKFTNGGIRFFACGEYGDKFGRPHYHACIFGYDFSDKVLWRERDGVRLYTSKLLSVLWPYGFSTVGDVTFDSAAYVARYVMKKVTGIKAKEYYTVMNPETGELFQRTPEFVLMSRRPGIGKEWFEKYFSDVYPGDFLVSRGVKMKPPRYYDGLYELANPVGSHLVKLRRGFASGEAAANNTLDRLKVRGQVAGAKLSRFKPRSVDDDS